jgi:DNA-binding SARP family transcriptional activator
MADHQFRVLGPLEVAHPGGSLTVAGARQQTLLTMLLLHANQVVPVSRLVEAIWDDMPPSTALAQVRICVCRLRRAFDRLGMEDAVRTHSSGYLLQATADSSDLARFEELLDRGRAAATARRTGEAVSLIRAALALWRGPVAGGLESPLLQASASRVNEEHATALEECFDLELRQGLHRTIIGELFVQASDHPYRERLSAQLMLALYRSDRQAEALEVYRGLRSRLDEELGIEPAWGPVPGSVPGSPRLGRCRSRRPAGRLRGPGRRPTGGATSSTNWSGRTPGCAPATPPASTFWGRSGAFRSPSPHPSRAGARRPELPPPLAHVPIYGGFHGRCRHRRRRCRHLPDRRAVPAGVRARAAGTGRTRSGGPARTPAGTARRSGRWRQRRRR